MAFRKRMKMPSFFWASTISGADSSRVAATGESSSGYSLRQLRCIRRVEMMEPQMAPARPTRAAVTWV